jgi:hypothetical protein
MRSHGEGVRREGDEVAHQPALGADNAEAAWTWVGESNTNACPDGDRHGDGLSPERARAREGEGREEDDGGMVQRSIPSRSPSTHIVGVQPGA